VELPQTTRESRCIPFHPTNLVIFHIRVRYLAAQPVPDDLPYLLYLRVLGHGVHSEPIWQVEIPREDDDDIVHREAQHIRSIADIPHYPAHIEREQPLDGVYHESERLGFVVIVYQLASRERAHTVQEQTATSSVTAVFLRCRRDTESNIPTI
jgi:hypothetical protein